MIALAIVAAPFVASGDPEPVTEAGLYAGTFLSNYYHRLRLLEVDRRHAT